MKQPELGQKILALRTSKGLTQEDLVEMCNISVRTIQRIEAGEVSPRSYTVRTIMDALEVDMSIFSNNISRGEQEFKELLLLDVNDTKKGSFLIKNLNLAWISGIIFFIITIPELIADFTYYESGEYLFGKAGYIVLKLLVAISYVFFFRGIILVGKLFDNYLLKISAFILLIFSVFFYLYDIVTIFVESIDLGIVLISESICYGAIGIIFGASLLRLKGHLATLGKVSGILEIAAAICFITVILSPLGLVLWTPAIIVEIILLYRVVSLIKDKQKQLS